MAHPPFSLKHCFPIYSTSLNKPPQSQFSAKQIRWTITGKTSTFRPEIHAVFQSFWASWRFQSAFAAQFAPNSTSSFHLNCVPIVESLSGDRIFETGSIIMQLRKEESVCSEGSYFIILHNNRGIKESPSSNRSLSH